MERAGRAWRELLAGAVLASLLLTACASPPVTAGTTATTVTSMPGFDITVPTSWHVVAVHDPYGTKFMSNTALQDPCAVAADGADWPGSADPAEPGPIRWVRISASQGTQWVFTVFCQVQRPMM